MSGRDGKREGGAQRRGGPVSGARAAAIRALLAVEEGRHCQEALAYALNECAIKDPRDRGLTTELVYGVLRWRRGQSA